MRRGLVSSYPIARHHDLMSGITATPSSAARFGSERAVLYSSLMPGTLGDYTDSMAIQTPATPAGARAQSSSRATVLTRERRPNSRHEAKNGETSTGSRSIGK